MKLKIATGLLCLAAASAVPAKTLYVDWNSSFIDNSQCTKNNPCDSIGAALVQATKGSKIIVYPGWYSEQVVIDKENIKLESLAGPRNTFIANDAAAIISVTGENAVIGKKGKGFGIWRDTESAENSTVAIHSTANKIRIEGNHLWPFDFTYGSSQSGAIIELVGTDKATITGNWFEAAKNGIVITSDEKASHLIQENEMYRMQGDCIRMTLNGGGSAKIRKNNLNSCRVQEGQNRMGDSHGILVDFLGVTGKATITDNVVQRTPIGYSVSGGNHVLQRNQHTSGRTGYIFNDADKPQLRDSLTQFMEQAVFLNENVTNATINNNYFHANEVLVHERMGTSSLKSFANNEIAQRSSGPGYLCAIATGGDSYPDGIVFKKNHWGGFAPALGSAAPDFPGEPDCSGTNAQTAFNNGQLQFDPIFKTAKFKYKDKSPL